MTVYLLHFNERYGQAGHYIGSAADLDARLAEHEAGLGERLLAVVKEAGIGWTLARTWPGGRARERQIKNQGGASRCCPMCDVRPRQSKEDSQMEPDYDGPERNLAEEEMRAHEMGLIAAREMAANHRALGADLAHVQVTSEMEKGKAADAIADKQEETIHGLQERARTRATDKFAREFASATDTYVRDYRDLDREAG